jgi:hypothetical protein
LIEPAYGTSAALTHFVKEPEDYRVLQAYFRDITVYKDIEQFWNTWNYLGDDGLPHINTGRTPYQQLWIQWVGVDDLAWHLAEYPAGWLCSQSAYMHGYIHGYENGFRQGDLDINLGHNPRAVSEIREFHRTSGYRSGFGDQSYFHLGYQQGFRAAYEDALHGIPFRGINQLRQAAEGRSLAGQRKDFDRAISAGYDAGYTTALRNTRPVVNARYNAEGCQSSHKDAAYCDAYGRGFLVGYSDGSVNQHSHLAETARADSSR